MNSQHLTQEQARQISVRVAESLGYLGRLIRRMEQRRFPPDDDLLMSARKAYDALFELRVKTHYLGCQGGYERRASGSSMDKQ